MKPNYTNIPQNAGCFSNEMSEEDKRLKDELKTYREEHPKPWYLR